MEHVIAGMEYLYLPWRNNEDVCPRMYFLPLEWDVGECRLPDQTRPWIDEETNLGWRGLAIPKIRMKEKKGMGGQIQILRESENDQKKCWSDTLVSFEPGFVWAQKAFQIQGTQMCLIPLSLAQPSKTHPPRKIWSRPFSLGIPIVNVAFSS